MLATVCMIDNNFSYKTMTRKSFLDNHGYEKLDFIWTYNAHKTVSALQFLNSQDSFYHFFRVSSSIFPLATLPEASQYWNENKEKYFKILSSVKSQLSTDFRIVCHPDQFCSLTSKDDVILNNTIRELQHTVDFMSAFNIDGWSMNIHFPCKTSDKFERLEYALKLMNDINPLIAPKISFENDEKSSSLDDIMKAWELFGTAICYDFHHDYCMRSRVDEQRVNSFYIPSEDQMEVIKSSWVHIGRRPSFHLSNSREKNALGMKANPHSDYLYDSDKNKDLAKYILSEDFDLEIEAKAKFPAVKKFYDYIKEENNDKQ